jgi:Tol biopolymer transport system component
MKPLIVVSVLAAALCGTARAETVELRAAGLSENGAGRIEFRSYGAPVAHGSILLRLPGGDWTPVRLSKAALESSPATTFSAVVGGGLALRLRIVQKGPSLVEQTLEVTAQEPARFALAFALEFSMDGQCATFSGPAIEGATIDTVRGSARVETFPVAMLQAGRRLFGIAADSPGLWENRCKLQIEPRARRLVVLAGDGGDPYSLVIKPPEDARDTYQYQMDGWQRLEERETREFTTWIFASPARTHYDAQVAAHLAVANGKGWNGSALEAILRNTAYYLLRRNLALDAHNQPRDGRFIFTSGPGYGWKQWVTDGFYCAIALDDAEKTIESNRAVFWTRMDYEDNAQYYLIWAALMKRAGGRINEALVRQAWQFIRRHEREGRYIPPPLPGAPNPKGWKTYHDVLPYDDGDCPTSNQGFHCGALLAARELGLNVADADVDRAIAAYRGLFNDERGFMPTSQMQRDVLGQDTLYGATLTYAVFGQKLLTDQQVLTHVRTSERVKTPFGLRVISHADGGLLDGHSGVYCYGGSWFLNDAANYLLAGVHGMPEQEVNALLVDRIAKEIVHAPAFNESISTVDGRPHGHILYAWNSGFWWLRKELRRRLGQVGADPVGAAIDARLSVVRENRTLRLDPDRAAGADPTQQNTLPDQWIGFTELETNLPGGRHANVRTMRAVIMRGNGAQRRLIAPELADNADAWTQFAGWSPDGARAIVARGWQDPANALWEEQQKRFRMEPGAWQLDNCLVELETGRMANVTAVERVSHYNGGLFFLPDRRRLGFTALINGVSKPFIMDGDGRNKQDVSGAQAGFAYGYSASPEGALISYHQDYQIYLASADGSNKRKIETGNPFNFGPRWSPDGQWLLFLGGRHGQSNPFIVRRDGTGLRKLADLNGYQGWVQFLDVDDFHQGSSDLPAWSADGRRVFFTALVNGNVELFAADLEGNAAQLTRSAPGSLHYHPQPSPDGQWLVYGSKRGGARNLYLMRLADLAEFPLTTLPRGRAAMWPYWQPVD